mmetsp:Transcript_191/g.495  ORF Transcript_191/g.495 Transcript_191/m.495 type:complete len:107 (+) Transcript_191:579-899(+)
MSQQTHQLLPAIPMLLKYIQKKGLLHSTCMERAHAGAARASGKREMCLGGQQGTVLKANSRLHTMSLLSKQSQPALRERQSLPALKANSRMHTLLPLAKQSLLVMK